MKHSIEHTQEHASTPPADKGVIARYFQFQAEGTTYRREIIGGVTTFLAMAYVLFVNPSILAETGMDKSAVFTATALSAVVGTLLMAVVARFPVAIAPSMSLNAFFAYSVVIHMGVPWQSALVGALASGLIFVLITIFRLRELVLNAIPHDLKMASACGIGLFIAFIGLKGSGLIVTDEATLVTLGDLSQPGTLLSILGLILTICLMIRNVPGAIFIGMLSTACLGMLMGVIDTPSRIVSRIPSIMPVFGVALTQPFTDPDSVFNTQMIVVILTFFMVEFFDAAGTLLAVAHKAGLMQDNRMKRSGRAMFSDSASIITGSIIGTSPTCSFLESSAGVESGARTGFAAVIVAALFALALFFSPLLHVVTTNVTAPALILLGVSMISVVGEIKWHEYEIAVPAFLMLVAMPLTYSVSNGIAMGMTLYPLTMLVKGRGREVHPALYGLAVIFVLYFAFLT